MVIVSVALVPALCLLAVVSARALWLRVSSKASRKPVFPGPSPLPIVGNILPSERVWITLSAIGEKYGRVEERHALSRLIPNSPPVGPIFSLKLLSTPVLVVNSSTAARDLFELRSANYANRPLPKIVQMAGFDRGVALEHDPARLRLGRKVMHSVIQPRVIVEFRDRIQHYLAIYLKYMIESPDRFVQHAKLLLAGVTLEMSHGYEISGPNDVYLGQAEILVKNFSQASYAGGHLVNWLPFLSYLPAWLPGMGFKRMARQWREHYDRVAGEAFDYAKSEITDGTARPSMVQKALADMSQDGIPEDIVKYSAAQVYSGGADTTASTIIAFILMMVRHPEVQSRAQAEIDTVTGHTRLPAFADRAQLPYVDAVLAEVLRVLPPIPAILRQPENDDIYEGRLIPKGTMMIENIWGMLHDRNVYPEPAAFRPERWLKADKQDIRHPLNVAFGFGRRICPGRLLAEELAFTAIALLLSSFDISCAHDDNGDPIVPAPEQTNGSIIFPLPFRCHIRPRNDRAQERVEEFIRAHT
ncbi:hypothetical protein NUW54_g5637 [Trametes sanguinea]|uniref:Uncharacterized protein n=1 Tax=Trametes sanguinea TaxID=158606 RepID=A0ACC1PX18_9APHY|nr:hypothetical protein NUW54_g5637 [Trametes sanguinea]